ncbi:GPR1/FUN34/yaaH family-domain-containing protein [Fomes fomentarius]|nr:GPR1/FUN34/yaaH family-domain-containing protein [Fomes fomentarius]
MTIVICAPLNSSGLGETFVHPARSSPQYHYSVSWTRYTQSGNFPSEWCLVSNLSKTDGVRTCHSTRVLSSLPTSTRRSPPTASLEHHVPHRESPVRAHCQPPPAAYSGGQTQYYRKLGNPGPLGLFGFASTTFILSLYNVQARGISHPNVVLGMALFVGGLAQFVAGMWEFATQNTFGATAFTMYGGFWMSFATIFLPGSGVLAAYESADELNSALGIYLWTWFIITFLLLVAATRRNLGLVVLFFFLTITFALLASSHFTTTSALALEKAGGALGIITALVAFYVGLAELQADPVNSWFVLPLGPIPKGRVD